MEGGRRAGKEEAGDETPPAQRRILQTAHVSEAMTGLGALTKYALLVREAADTECAVDRCPAWNREDGRGAGVRIFM